MITLKNNVVRVRLNALSYDAPEDVKREQFIQFWRCNDLEFQVGITQGEELVDVSNLQTLYVSVRALDAGNPPSGGAPVLMLASTNQFDTSVTKESWANGSSQHAIISFSAKENALEAGAYWISFWATTNDQHTITLSSGVCRILESGGISSTPPEPKDVYYTAETCDERFALKGSGGGGGMEPERKGELIVGNGDGASHLAIGDAQQVLVVDPNSDVGIRWGNYPWQFIKEVRVTEPAEELLLENVFDGERFWTYKLLFSHIHMTVQNAQMRMMCGVRSDGGGTVWVTDPQEYNYHTADFSGTLSRFATYPFVNGFFGFGNEASTYRNDGGYVNGMLTIWNDGNPEHNIQARADTNSYRAYSDTIVSNGGLYNFTYRNVGAQVVRSLRFFLEDGNFISGKFTLYGIC